MTGKPSKTKRKRRSPGGTPSDASRTNARPKEAAATRRAAGRSEARTARRDEVLDAARALIAEHGVAGASLRKLASQLGISQPSQRLTSMRR